MITELQLLREIKQQFGWPVDTLRYAIPSKSRYVYNTQKQLQTLDPLNAKRVKESLRKLAFAQKWLRLLTVLPWIQGILVTGSVAALNAKENDDIDIWLLVTEKRLWLTRSFDILLYGLLGLRRFAGDSETSPKMRNKFCFNYYMSVSALALPEKSPSFAMQFVDAIPLWFRENGVYAELVRQNKWVATFFPSWYVHVKRWVYDIPFHIKRDGIVVEKILNFFEYGIGCLMLSKAKKQLILSKKEVYSATFTTWGTPRILSRYDYETFAKGSQEK